jgi:hypothetical protein
MICFRYAYFDNAVINTTRIKLTYKIYVELVASLVVNILKFQPTNNSIFYFTLDRSRLR